MRVLRILVAAAGLYVLTGCASLTGLVTGPFTGAVDAPAQVYRQNPAWFDQYPITWSLNVLVVAPIGIVCGAPVGFAKGIALDVQWAIDHIDYGSAFEGYGPATVWRPYTWQWNRKRLPTDPPDPKSHITTSGPYKSGEKVPAATGTQAGPPTDK
jgi:hypothetical protein